MQFSARLATLIFNYVSKLTADEKAGLGVSSISAERFDRDDETCTVDVDCGGFKKSFSFCFSHSPFNTDILVPIDDKLEIYRELNEIFAMPRTIAFGRPSANRDQVVQEILNQFSFPLVVKPEHGSLSADVFIVRLNEELTSAVERILQSQENGFYLLAQEYIGPSDETGREFRAVFFDGKIAFVLERNANHVARQSGDLANPEFWQGASIALIDNGGQDAEIVWGAESICRLFALKTKATYFGLDLRLHNGSLYIIEANSSPMHLGDVKGMKSEIVEHLLSRMVTKMAETTKREAEIRHERSHDRLRLEM